MAKIIASRPPKPDPAFVHALEEKLLGKKVTHWQRWLLWISLPSLTTVALMTALFIHPQANTSNTLQTDSLYTINEELHSVEVDTIGTLNAIEQQLDL